MPYFNTEFFIARRIFSEQGNKRRISRSIISFAIFGIAIGTAIMLLSIAIATGFKSEVRSKVVGFGSHIQVVNYDSNSSYQTNPIPATQPWVEKVKELEGVKHIQMFSTKPGIIKTDEDFHGTILKGVADDFDWSFFRDNMVSGSIFTVTDSARTNDVIIAAQVASSLKLNVGDPLYMYFQNEASTTPRMRRFNICGIFKSSFEEFDKLFILGDIKHVNSLNNWQPGEISGYEITINDFEDLSNMTQALKASIAENSKSRDLATLRTINIEMKYPQIFDWLNLLDMNVWVIISLIVIVAGFNMISGLLILILERTNMIGVLKSLGFENRSIRKVFIYLSAFLIGKGMIWGNIIGIAICILQHRYGIMKLNPESYFVDVVPINFKLAHVILLNIGTLAATVFMLMVPSWYVSKINPSKTIKFD